ncbi:MAG: DUF6431 domain-containing protein [Halobacteriota archaeon]
MILYHSFEGDVEEYARRGKENHFPSIECCPACHARARLKKHGFYERFAVEGENVWRLFIQRLKCVSCNKTFTILPDFLVPKFQSTFATILQLIREKLRQQKVHGSRQLAQFYTKRFLKRLPLVEMFFRSQGNLLVLPVDPIKKAIKAVQLILDFGESSFLRRSLGQLATPIMALSFYQISNVSRRS